MDCEFGDAVKDVIRGRGLENWYKALHSNVRGLDWRWLQQRGHVVVSCWEDIDDFAYLYDGQASDNDRQQELAIWRDDNMNHANDSRVIHPWKTMSRHSKGFEPAPKDEKWLKSLFAKNKKT